MEKIVVGPRGISDFALSMAPGRDVHVIVRSPYANGLDGARVTAVRGRVKPRRGRDYTKL